METSRLKRAIGTKEFRLRITEEGEARSYTILAESRDAAWEQIADTIRAPESDADVSLALVRG